MVAASPREEAAVRFTEERLLTKPPAAAVTQHVAELIRQNVGQVDAEHRIPQDLQITRVGVVGAGAMGIQIASHCVRHGFSVQIHDRDQHALQAAPARLAAALDGLALTGEPGESSAAGELLCEVDLTALHACELIIESVPEKPDLKRAVLAQLEAVVPDGTILASNTSSIPIAQLGMAMDRPERLVGLHFFLPFGERPMIEITSGPKTSRPTAATAIAFCRRVDHLPLVVRDGAGFVVNRLLMSYLGGAIDLLTGGFELADIERAAEEFGMPAGPFRAYDEIGIDVAIHCGIAMASSAHEQVLRSPLLVWMVKAGLLGRKAGRGFFAYDDVAPGGSPNTLPSETRVLIDRCVSSGSPAENQLVVAGLVLPVALEATRLITEERARGPGQIDLGAMFGFGFPRCHGGPLYWMDELGAATVVELLEPFADLSPRYRPTPLLLEMAASGQRFYDAAQA
jgi:3-hydroxyacyl-CoA dehydrogenase